MLDFAIHRGVAMLIIGALLLGQAALQLRSFAGPGVIIAIPPEMRLRLGWSIFWTFSFIAVLMTVNGMVSGDRRQGYFRFLFSKPLSIAGYYASAFAVGLLGVLLASVAMYLAVWWIGIRLPVQVLVAVAMIYALVGAIGFFYSTIMSREWLGVIATLVVVGYLHFRIDRDGGTVGSLARYLLPPIHLGNAVRDATLSGALPEATILFWTLGYGLVVLAAALLVLRRRPLA